MKIISLQELCSHCKLLYILSYTASWKQRKHLIFIKVTKYIHTHIIMHMFIHTVHDTSAVTMQANPLAVNSKTHRLITTAIVASFCLLHPPLLPHHLVAVHPHSIQLHPAVTQMQLVNQRDMIFQNFTTNFT